MKILKRLGVVQEAYDETDFPLEELEEGEGEIESGETAVINSNVEISTAIDDSQELSAVLESLNLYAGNIERLIETKTCTQETANLVCFGAQQQMNKLGAKFRNYSLESEAYDVVQQHELALESIQDIIKLYSQSYVLQYKHHVDMISDSVRSTSSMLNKYETKLREAKKEFDSKKGELKDDDYKLKLIFLWYFFATEKGVSTNLAESIKHDVDASKYLLVDYPKAIIALLKKATSDTNASSIKDEAGIIKFLKSVEALPHPIELFTKKDLIGGNKLLDKVGLVEDAGSARNPLTFSGTTFTKLAALATPKKFTETSSTKHQILKAVYTGFAENTKFSGVDIGKIIDGGLAYLENVRQYVKLETEMVTLCANFLKANKAFDNINDELNKDKTVRALFVQREDYMLNILSCFQNPAKAEVVRALKGAKYCTYAGLRMITNAEDNYKDK